MEESKIFICTSFFTLTARKVLIKDCQFSIDAAVFSCMTVWTGKTGNSITLFTDLTRWSFIWMFRFLCHSGSENCPLLLWPALTFGPVSSAYGRPKRSDPKLRRKRLRCRKLPCNAPASRRACRSLWRTTTKASRCSSKWATSRDRGLARKVRA